MRRRVVATGIGTISGAGRNSQAFLNALRRGESAFSDIVSRNRVALKATHASLVPDDAFDFSLQQPPAVIAMDRIVHLALEALHEALESAQLCGALGDRAALVLGTCSGGMLSIEKHLEGQTRGEEILDASLSFSKKYYTPAKALAWSAGISGPVFTIVTACAAGAGAISQATDILRSGLSDIAIAGGADTFAQSTLIGFDALKATCAGACTPFSKNVGLNLGEGSAFLVLESLEHAMGRNATILAEILGSGLSNDAYHPTSPDPSTRGQVAAMNRALGDAGLASSDVDYVNAHGTGTRANDPTECRSIRKVLGDRADSVPTSSTKSIIGHCLGAAGTLEIAATVLALREGFLPSTVGFTEPRDGCNLGDFVPDANRAFSGNIALSNSFGFGGNNACIVVDTYPDIEAPSGGLPSVEREQPVITGFGLVHAMGLGITALDNTEATGLRPIDRFEAGEGPLLAGLVPSLDPRDVDRRLDIRGMDLCSRYATFASRIALEHAAHPMRPAQTADVGMVLGLATGPTEGETNHLKTVFQSAAQIGRLDAFPFVVQNEVAGHVARSLFLKGHNTVISGGWGAGLLALISGAVAIRSAHTDTVIAAAADELTEQSFRDGRCVGPWRSTDGLFPGEGASALVIEDRSSAEARGVEPLAEILGFGLSTDIENPMTASPVSIEKAVIQAVERSGIDPARIKRVATTLKTRREGAWENEVAARHFGSAKITGLIERLGFAEASMPLFNLAYLIGTSPPNSPIAVTSLSREGFASAMVLRVL
jgi:3-oxoacyl-[acyl-carrier-protein] synthase II